MNDDKAVALKPTTDIVGEDKEKLDKFIEEGLPGIGSVEPANIDKMLDLYKFGKNYNAISVMMRVPKVVVLYLSHKQNWLSARHQYYKDMANNLPQRMLEAEILAKDVLFNEIQAFHKKHTERRNRLLVTGVEDATTRIDPKEYALFLKTVEMSKKSNAIPEPKGPMVSVHVGSTKATVTQTDNNTIEVNANENMTEEQRDAEELKYYANLSRQKDKK